MISLSLPGSTAAPCCAIVGLISCGALILPVLAPRERCAVTGEVSSGSRLTPLFTGVRGRGFSEVGVQRMSHSPAPWPPYGRLEPSRLLKDVRLLLRILTPTGGQGVVRSYDPRSTTGGTACLTSVCVQGDLKAAIYGQARRVVETTFFA